MRAEQAVQFTVPDGTFVAKKTVASSVARPIAIETSYALISTMSALKRFDIRVLCVTAVCTVLHSAPIRSPRDSVRLRAAHETSCRRGRARSRSRALAADLLGPPAQA